MKYGVVVKIVEIGYVEVEADCEQEAKDIAGGNAMEGLVLFHDAEVESCEIERILEGDGEQEGWDTERYDEWDDEWYGQDDEWDDEWDDQ